MYNKRKVFRSRIYMKEYKSKEERQIDVKNIINELAHFNLTPQYEAIQKLYEYFKRYIESGDYIKINIPFPMINKRFRGELLPTKGKDSHLRLVHENF